MITTLYQYGINFALASVKYIKLNRLATTTGLASVQH